MERGGVPNGNLDGGTVQQVGGADEGGEGDKGWAGGWQRRCELFTILACDHCPRPSVEVPRSCKVSGQTNGQLLMDSNLKGHY